MRPVFIPATFFSDISQEDLGRSVQKFAFVCTHMGDSGYHWRIFMALGNDIVASSIMTRARSIELDIMPRSANGTAKFSATSKLYELTENLISDPVIVYARRGTVGEIIRHLLYMGRDKYRFIEGEVKDVVKGCRFWCEVVAEDLEEEGYIQNGEADQVKEGMDKIMQNELGKHVPALPGEFYGGPTTHL